MTQAADFRDHAAPQYAPYVLANNSTKLTAQRPYFYPRHWRGMPQYHIVEASPDDYMGICAVHNAAYPDNPLTPTQLASADSRRDPRAKHKRWIAKKSQIIVAAGGFSQPTDPYHPRKFAFNIFIHPDHRRHGIGQSILEHIWSAIKPFNPITLRTITSSDQEDAIRFLQQNNFSEEMRSWHSVLDLDSIDLNQFPDMESDLHKRGIAIKSFGELETDGNRDEKLLQLWNRLSQDVPSPEPLKSLSNEKFTQLVLESDSLVSDAFSIAVQGRQYIGLSVLFARPNPSELYNDLTGVTPEFRHCGVALSLKLRNIAYAQSNGYSKIITINTSNNQAIVSLNHKLGFRRGISSISFIRQFSETV